MIELNPIFFAHNAWISNTNKHNNLSNTSRKKIIVFNTIYIYWIKLISIMNINIIESNYWRYLLRYLKLNIFVHWNTKLYLSTSFNVTGKKFHRIIKWIFHTLIYSIKLKDCLTIYVKYKTSFNTYTEFNMSLFRNINKVSFREKYVFSTLCIWNRYIDNPKLDK